MHVSWDFHIFGPNFNTRCGLGISFMWTNFKTFGNMSQKLWANMWFISQLGQFGQIWKNHFFLKWKFEIHFLGLYKHKKLWTIPFWSMSQKLWGFLVCGQLWILYSQINFEVLYWTQFSIFLKKNKNIRSRLFTTILQPLGLVIFNSINKLSTI